MLLWSEWARISLSRGARRAELLIRISTRPGSLERCFPLAMFIFASKVQKGAKMISDAAIEVFKNASIQPRFLSLCLEDVTKLEALAKEVKEILDRGVTKDGTPEWLKPHRDGNGTALRPGNGAAPLLGPRLFRQLARLMNFCTVVNAGTPVVAAV